MRNKDENNLIAQMYSRVLNEQASYVTDRQRRAQEKMARKSKTHSRKSYDEKGKVKKFEPGEGESMEERVALLRKQHLGGGLPANWYQKWWTVPIQFVVAEYFASKGQHPPPAEKDIIEWYKKLVGMGLERKHPKPEDATLGGLPNITTLEQLDTIKSLPAVAPAGPN